MIVSSRTPEGRRGHCDICNHDVCVEPSWPTGDAPCPNCGCLLWFAPRRPTVAQLLAPMARDAAGRPVDTQGNILDPLTGAVDFAATLGPILALPRQRVGSAVPRPSFWRRLLALLGGQRSVGSAPV